ncbi:hypothetical protein D5W64_12815 [Salmonella enterica subsp. enterica serovar Saintpaul]|nr:hypothetical protein [Salmonella enterica subsp. enterica serovar Saintpaul]
MQRLYPVATPETRHLFVDPGIQNVWGIDDSKYVGKDTSFLKPGKIPNLVLLCQPDGEKFTVTEEVDPDKIFIDEILFGIMDDNGIWQVCIIDELNTRLAALSPATWGLDGVISVYGNQITTIYGDSLEIDEDKIILIDIKIDYARATRCMEISSKGTYDNGKPQLYGVTFNLEHKDSKMV